jgi:hypothetical protein
MASTKFKKRNLNRYRKIYPYLRRATLESPDNANYQMYVFNVTKTAAVVRLSAYAHSTLTVKIHAISRT